MPPHLLTIPPELRTRIWELALNITDTPPVICPDSSKKGDTLKVSRYKFANRAMQPSLTRTNRQVRAETLPMFYRRNTFEVGWGLGRGWLDCIGENATHLRSLYATTWDKNTTAIVYLPAFVGTISRADVHVRAARKTNDITALIDFPNLGRNFDYPVNSVKAVIKDIFEGVSAEVIGPETWLRVLDRLDGYFVV
ncbi:hypothetical protein LTR15_007914 [Elasticomyces elasticus]|nr:hypothetical protein LTR15_007914 [Elasticomyces elasticus]